MKVSLQALNPNIPGQAILTIEDWEGSSNIEISILRNLGQLFFKELGQPWISSETWLQIPNLQKEGNIISGIVEKWLVDEILTQPPNVRFRVTVRELGDVDGVYGKAFATLVIDPEICSSSALGNTYIPENVVVTPTAIAPAPLPELTPATLASSMPEQEPISEPAPEPVPEPAPEPVPEPAPEPAPEPVPEPTPEPVPEPAPVIQPMPRITPEAITATPEPEPVLEKQHIIEEAPKKPNKTLLWIILAVVILLILAVAAWFLKDKFLGKSSPAPASVAASTPAATTANVPTESACTVTENTTPDSNEFFEKCSLERIDTMLKGEIYTIIEQANEHGKCDIARRLFSYKANKDSEFAMNYAKAWADGDQACFPKDIETAKYWFESILDADPHNAEAKERLEELNK